MEEKDSIIKSIVDQSIEDLKNGSLKERIENDKEYSDRFRYLMGLVHHHGQEKDPSQAEIEQAFKDTAPYLMLGTFNFYLDDGKFKSYLNSLDVEQVKEIQNGMFKMTDNKTENTQDFKTGANQEKPSSGMFKSARANSHAAGASASASVPPYNNSADVQKKVDRLVKRLRTAAEKEGEGGLVYAMQNDRGIHAQTVDFFAKLEKERSKLNDEPVGSSKAEIREKDKSELNNEILHRIKTGALATELKAMPSHVLNSFKKYLDKISPDTDQGLGSFSTIRERGKWMSRAKKGFALAAGLSIAGVLGYDKLEEMNPGSMDKLPAPVDVTVDTINGISVAAWESSKNAFNYSACQFEQWTISKEIEREGVNFQLMQDAEFKQRVSLAEEPQDVERTISLQQGELIALKGSDASGDYRIGIIKGVEGLNTSQNDNLQVWIPQNQIDGLLGQVDRASCADVTRTATTSQPATPSR